MKNISLAKTCKGFPKSVNEALCEPTYKDYVTPFVLALAVLMLTLLVCVFEAKAQVVTVDLEVIAMIESSGCKDKVSKRPGDQSHGCHQITPITLKEWNNFHPQDQHTFDDLLNDEVSYKIADWYLRERIPAMIRYYKKPVTLENILISYNAGINYVKTGKPIPEITKRYLKKYERLIHEKAS